MKGTEMIQETLSKYEENELIFVSKLYREKFAEHMTEAAFYKAIERMYKSGVLCKVAKGVYCIPKKGKYGTVPPSEKEIVSAFTENGIGMEVGYTLYNSLNLTTQISKNVVVLSSALDGFSKSIGNVVIEHQELHFTESVKRMVAAMEVFRNYSEIQDLNYTEFLEFTKNFAKEYDEEIFEEIIKKMRYPKATIAFAEEVLKHYKVENRLCRYLSAFSDYKYPRMREIYAAACGLPQVEKNQKEE